MVGLAEASVKLGGNPLGGGSERGPAHISPGKTQRVAVGLIRRSFQALGRPGQRHLPESSNDAYREEGQPPRPRLPVRPAVGVGRTMRALRSLTQTDACPKSCSGARNSGPMGLDNIDHQRQLQIPGASLPLAWMSLRARRRTVAHSAVARFSADMEVITCAHVHVQELKLLPCCPFMRSSIKHVDPCTGSLASPLLALSPSSSSTFGCAQESQSRPE